MGGASGVEGVGQGGVPHAVDAAQFAEELGHPRALPPGGGERRHQLDARPLRRGGRQAEWDRGLWAP